jgi:threonine dehydrogenase-like Zn-dependent dehydrogenase
MPKQHRCSALELLPSMRCGTVAHSPATLLRCWVLAGWGTSEFNSLTNLVIRPPLSGAGPKTRRWPSSKAMSGLIDGLGPNGKLMVMGLSFDPIEVTPAQLISRNRTIQGWAAGTPTDSEDTPRFAELTGVRPMIETYPLENADEAYARMMSGKAQFRVVLTM